MPGDRGEAHLLEQPAERRRIGRGVFDELEAVGAERVVPEVVPRAAVWPCRVPSDCRSISAICSQTARNRDRRTNDMPTGAARLARRPCRSSCRQRAAAAGSRARARRSARASTRRRCRARRATPRCRRPCRASGRVARPAALARARVDRHEAGAVGFARRQSTAAGPTHGSTPWASSVASSIHAGAGGAAAAPTSASTRSPIVQCPAGLTALNVPPTSRSTQISASTPRDRARR